MHTEEEFQAVTAENAKLKDDISKVNDQNSKLLSEKKEAIAATKASDAKTTETQHNCAALQRKLNEALLTKPVELLGDAISTDPELFHLLINQSHKFELGEDGRPVFLNKDGTPVMAKDKEGRESPVPFDGEAISKYLVPDDHKNWTPEQKRFASVIVGSRALGSGAPGGVMPHVNPPTPSATNNAPPQKFGLR